MCKGEIHRKAYKPFYDYAKANQKLFKRAQSIVPKNTFLTPATYRKAYKQLDSIRRELERLRTPANIIDREVEGGPRATLQKRYIDQKNIVRNMVKRNLFAEPFMSLNKAILLGPEGETPKTRGGQTNNMLMKYKTMNALIQAEPTRDAAQIRKKYTPHKS